MPEMMKKPAGKAKKRPDTTFADDDLDLDMPQDMPLKDPVNKGSLAKGRTVGAGLPSARVDTGDVAINNPHPEMGMSIGNQYGNFLQGINSNDDDIGEGEEVEEPVPPVEETLPAIIQSALSTTAGEVKSYQMANIVSRQPPQVRKELEKVGRDIFSQHSKTPKSLKDIYSISSLTNSETEVKLMVAWVLMHGRKISDTTYNFPSMPGYKPKAELWEDEGARFLIVRETPKDFAGEEIEATFDDPEFEEKVDNKECIFYIYGWDEPTGKIGNSAVKADLLEVATQLVKRFPGQTVREAYEELALEYLREEAEEKCIQCDVKLPSGGRTTKKGLGPFCPACYKHEIEQSFDDDDFEEKIDNKQCLFYIYGWDEPKGKIGDGGLRAGLIEAATQLVKRFPGQTVREVYDEVVLEYLNEVHCSPGQSEGSVRAKTLKVWGGMVIF